MNFKTKLKILLVLHDFTQKEFADKIGISEQSLSHYLTGRNFPPGNVVQKMAENFKIDASYLLDDKYEFQISYKPNNANALKVAERPPQYIAIEKKIDELLEALKKLKGE